jgi:uncharacterized protein DUF6881
MDRTGIEAALECNGLKKDWKAGIWYLRVQWLGAGKDDPIEIFSEVGQDGYETRKVHRFADGRLEWTDKKHEFERTGLATVPVRTVEEIAAMGEFLPQTITREEFEAAWAQARKEQA